MTLLFIQGLRKAEGSAEKMQHFVKIREQSIQTQQQEIAVSFLRNLIY